MSTPTPPQLNNATSAPPASPAPQASSLESILAELRVRPRRPGTTLGASVGSAVEALWSNRGRSFLTALGIVIGIAAVIGALILTQGANAYFQNQLSGLATTIIVFPGAGVKGGVSQGGASLSTLTLNDVQSLQHVPHVTAVSPFVTTDTQVVYGRQSWSTITEGVDENVLTLQSLQMAEGSWLTQNDETNGTMNAVLGDTVRHSLFDASGRDPVGQTIIVGGQRFRVVGVVAPVGGGFAQDDVIYIPLKTAQVRLQNTSTVDRINVQVDSTSNIDQAQQDITALLRSNHHISGKRVSDFDTFNFAQDLQSANQSSLVLEFLLVGIAAISLTVGGIGIMNIMLVSVTERTWEIGIRMSMGARRRDIRNQFLIEALLLCLVGGAIGLLLGLLIGNVLTSATQLPFLVTPATLILPFAVSAAIAIVFGLYPAIQAARLDPIVAIRTDE
ncbi:MAG: ABC transporter permease [Ktedonobacteraceae bacterium]|nr:ABC transporter permease [Ktedonobacteraceae bacterium]